MTDKVNTGPFIVAAHLDSPLMVAEYLAAGIEGPDGREATAGELRAIMAEAIAALRRLQDERDDDDRLRENMGGILTRTANALKGKPDERMLHSWHDLPEWGQAARDVAMLLLASTAPGAGEEERAMLARKLNAWRERYGRDLAENVEALAELDKDKPCEKCGKPWGEHEFGVPAPYCP